MFEIAGKFNDLLEEENLDFLDFKDRLELSIGQALFYDSEGMVSEALEELQEYSTVIEEKKYDLEIKVYSNYCQVISKLLKK